MQTARDVGHTVCLYVCTLTHIDCTGLALRGPWSELIADGTRMFITASNKAEHDPQPPPPTTQPCAPSPSHPGCPPGRIHRRCSTLVFMCFQCFTHGAVS